MYGIKRNLISMDDIFRIRKHHGIRLFTFEYKLKKSKPFLSNAIVRLFYELELQELVLRTIMKLEYKW